MLTSRALTESPNKTININGLIQISVEKQQQQQQQ